MLGSAVLPAAIPASPSPSWGGPGELSLPAAAGMGEGAQGVPALLQGAAAPAPSPALKVTELWGGGEGDLTEILIQLSCRIRERN